MELNLKRPQYWMDFRGMFKERWYGSVGMAIETVKRKFLYGGCAYDWRGACIVPLYKGKGDKCECSNSRCINLLSVVDMLFGRIRIKRDRAGTESAIEQEQCGFRRVEDDGSSVCRKAGL